MLCEQNFNYMLLSTSEAEYAFERRKLIIPVQVEHGYQPDGWLGMIIGTKFRYNLVKYYERDMGDLISRANQIKSSESEGEQNHTIVSFSWLLQTS